WRTLGFRRAADREDAPIAGVRTYARAGAVLLLPLPAVRTGLLSIGKANGKLSDGGRVVYAQRTMLLSSQVERESDLFYRRRDRMTGLVAELRERTARVAAGGGEKSVERHRSRGKLTARERIDLLVDPDSAFLELSALAAWDVYEDEA